MRQRLVIFCLIAVFTAGCLPKASEISVQDTEGTPSQTPFPFQEMTIPYLQSRTYPSQMGEQTLVAKSATYTSYLTSYTSDGLRINGLLTIPTGTVPEGGYPAIVFVHGYIPPTLYRTREKYVAYVDGLAKSGFVVFKIDLRGHDQSEGVPTGAYYSGDYIIDTRSAISALKTLPNVNPDRVGLWGHSMAGNIVSRTLASKPDIHATVIWAGAGYTYTDLLTYRLNDQSYRPPASSNPSSSRRQEMNSLYGQFDSSSEFWKQVPATNYLSGVSGAIGLFHAKDDTVVSIEYSRNLNRILDTTSIRHELHEYPSGGHNITGPNFSKAMADTINFFKRNL